MKYVKRKQLRQVESRSRERGGGGGVGGGFGVGDMLGLVTKVLVSEKSRKK